MEELFLLLFLIFADEQPLLRVEVLPAYIYEALPAAVPAPGCLIAFVVNAPHEVNLFLSLWFVSTTFTRLSCLP